MRNIQMERRVQAMKKIPVQLLADSLGLSRVTVWKVLNDRPGVSSATKKRVLDAAKGFDHNNVEPITNKRILKTAGSNQGYVSLLMSRANSSTFWLRILNQVASEVNQRQYRLNYLPIDAISPKISDLSTMLAQDRSQGLMIVNIYDDDVIELLSKLDVPKVYFDTTPRYSVDDLNGDLFLLNGQDPIRQITSELIEEGCKTLGFIGDCHYAKTNLMRWNGFKLAMKDSRTPIKDEFNLLGPMDPEHYREGIEAFLDSLSTLPDAFVCASDFVASTTLDLLSKRGIQVPKHIRLSGYDNSSDFHLENHNIKTVNVQNELIGKRMVHQLRYRMDNPEADFEEITLNPKITEIL